MVREASGDLEAMVIQDRQLSEDIVGCNWKITVMLHLDRKEKIRFCKKEAGGEQTSKRQSSLIGKLRINLNLDFEENWGRVVEILNS